MRYMNKFTLGRAAAQVHLAYYHCLKNDDLELWLQCRIAKRFVELGGGFWDFQEQVINRVMDVLEGDYYPPKLLEDDFYEIWILCTHEEWLMTFLCIDEDRITRQILEDYWL